MRSIKKKCLMCGNAVNKNAQKCIHCNSYLNWKRHIDFGNTSIALLIALVTAIGAFSERLYDALIKKDIDVTAMLGSDVNFESISVIFSNNGKHDVIIPYSFSCSVPLFADGVDLNDLSKGYLTLRDTSYDEVVGNYVSFYRSKSGGILSPQKTVEVKYSYGDSIFNRSRKPFELQFPKDGNSVAGVCSFYVGDIKGNLTGVAATLSAIDVFSFQEPTWEKVKGQSLNVPER